jgi:hypothetical protein
MTMLDRNKETIVQKTTDKSWEIDSHWDRRDTLLPGDAPPPVLDSWDEPDTGS